MQQLQLGSNVAKGEDGKHVVVLIISLGPTCFQIALPPDAADIAGDTLGPALKENAANARRADTGLLIATTVPHDGRNNL